MLRRGHQPVTWRQLQGDRGGCGTSSATTWVIDTPISENGICGVGLGLAITGMRPWWRSCSRLHRGCMDQLVNQVAKIRYMSGGQVKANMVVRTVITAAEESRRLSTPRACMHGSCTSRASRSRSHHLTILRGLLKTAIAWTDHCDVLRAQDGLQPSGRAPFGEWLIEFGKADHTPGVPTLPSSPPRSWCARSGCWSSLGAEGISIGGGRSAHWFHPMAWRTKRLR